MKIAITADLHLNNSTYGLIDKETRLPIRSLDAIKALEFFVNKCIEMKVDRVVLAGDVYESHAPSNQVRMMFNAQVQKLISANIQVVMMVGNHDVCEHHHALLPSKGWSRIVKIVDEPVVEKRDDFTCIYIPHSKAIQSGQETFPASIRRVVPDSSQLSHPRIFFGHFAVKGALMNDYKPSSGRSDVSVGDITSTGADIAFLGHFHKFQRLEADIPAYYVGSLERHDMTDTSEDRAFMVYDTATQEVERIPYTAFRPMRKIYGASYTEVMDEITAEESWRDHIVKIDFAGGKVEYSEIKSRAGDITREFKARGGTHIYLADVKFIEDAEDGDEIETIDQIDINVMVSKAIEEDITDPAERQEYLAMYDNLRKEAIKA